MYGGKILFKEAKHFKTTLKAQINDLDREVRDRLMSGADPKGYEYVKAIHFKEDARLAVERMFENIDVLLSPTVPITAPNINQRKTDIGGIMKDIRSILRKNTCPWNYTGHPSLSVPCGFSNDHLPIGLQLTGPMNSEAQLYRFGYHLERFNS